MYAKMHTEDRCISIHSGVLSAHKEPERCCDGEKEELTASFQVKQIKNKKTLSNK